ncbi:hypothetical protein Tco_1426318 [Tanacetum coccineum]
MADRYKMMKSEHDGCARKLEVLENRNSELSQVNKDQALQIKELGDELAKKDSALVYVKRINAERAQEKRNNLVASTSKNEMNRFDYMQAPSHLWPIELFQIHEYKQSIYEPFNLDIQAGWAKGLFEERFKEDLL